MCRVNHHFVCSNKPARNRNCSIRRSDPPNVVNTFKYYYKFYSRLTENVPFIPAYASRSKAIFEHTVPPYTKIENPYPSCIRVCEKPFRQQIRPSVLHVCRSTA